MNTIIDTCKTELLDEHVELTPLAGHVPAAEDVLARCKAALAREQTITFKCNWTFDGDIVVPPIDYDSLFAALVVAGHLRRAGRTIKAQQVIERLDQIMR